MDIEYIIKMKNYFYQQIFSNQFQTNVSDKSVITDERRVEAVTQRFNYYKRNL
jgi:hypothetical protein